MIQCNRDDAIGFKRGRMRPDKKATVDDVFAYVGLGMAG